MGVVIIILVVTGENKINSNFDQLKLGQVCNFGVEFDDINISGQPPPPSSKLGYVILPCSLIVGQAKISRFYLVWHRKKIRVFYRNDTLFNNIIVFYCLTHPVLTLTRLAQYRLRSCGCTSSAARRRIVVPRWGIVVLGEYWFYLQGENSCTA